MTDAFPSFLAPFPPFVAKKLANRPGAAFSGDQIQFLGARDGTQLGADQITNAILDIGKKPGILDEDKVMKFVKKAFGIANE